MLWLALFVPVGLAAQEGGADDKWTPKFDDERAEKYFERAREAFEKKSFKKAASDFKRALRGAAGDEDRKKVEAWVGACGAGIQLLKAEILAKNGRKKSAYFLALDLRTAFAETPALASIDAFLNEQKNDVLQVVADFESPHGLNEKFGNKWVNKPEDTYHGQGCAQWSQTPDKKGFQLKVTSVPRDWSDFESVVFWLKAPKPSAIDVVARTPGAVDQQLNVHRFTHKPRRGSKWVRVECPLDKFQKLGAGNLKVVETLVLQASPPQKDFEFFVDYICLVKK